MRLVLPDVPVGLNGTKGLLRMGYRARSRYNKYWHQLVRSAAIPTGRPPRGKQMVFI